MIPSVSFSEATITYLNLGLQGMASYGVSLSDNQKFLQIYPNLIVFPSVIMALMMISFNLFGNGLRDAFNPSLKGQD
jgi:oligopeptide transport system permease protein